MSGVTVDTADSAAAALDRIGARDYDAIVTDIKMPGMDGLALLDRDPGAAARHAHPDDHRPWRACAGDWRAPRRGLRLHSEADRPRLLRGVAAPGDSGERFAPPGEGAAAGARAPGQRSRTNRRGAHARTARDQASHRDPLEMAGRHQPADGAHRPPDPAGGGLSADDPRRGGNRHGQRARGPGDPSSECPAQEAVRRRGLRRDPGHADRVGALRLREGRVHRRASAKGGTVSARGGRNPVPRRDRQHPARRPRRSCCARCRNGRRSRSAARGRSVWTCESSPPPMSRWTGRSRKVASARTCTIV